MHLIRLFTKDPNLAEYAEELADGAAVGLWRLAQSYVEGGRAVIPHGVFGSTVAKPKLIEANLVKEESNGFYVVGSAEYLSWLEKKRKAGSKGGSAKSETKKKTLKQYRSKTEARPKQDRSTAEAKPKPLPTSSSSSSSSFSNSCSSNLFTASEKTHGSEVWESYSKAFFERYGVNPVRNAKTNSQCKQLGERLGRDAHEVIAFYLAHNDAWYLKRQHDLGSLLQAAESLHTQWQRGQAVTGAQVRQFEKQSTNLDLLEKVKRGEL